MDWGNRKHPAEVLAEWGAPAILAAAVAWAALAITATPAAAIAGGFSAYLIGFATIRGLGGEPAGKDLPAFEPAAFEDQVSELLLDELHLDELLLDDPLIEAASESRVSTLFDRPEQRPGALVARIADYLGDHPQRAVSTTGREQGQIGSDAHEALHEALANIRASLR